ncbi:MAG: acylneuraminate cytidylyltransferase family protein [Candidatus Omnitrophica bacterium]|nr:acylneuraminate cytidylyltransferase family protein [Candidatus Omnitrophota bacterium]
MEILGLIPARGGSKGIPKKNLVPLAGRPLLAYTCEQALAALSLSRVVLTTDDPSIAECGRAAGVDVPFLRPQALAADETPMVDVVRHALDTLRAAEGYQPDLVVLLQPTSPLRSAKHIHDAIQLHGRTNAETVVSVVAVPHRYSPHSLMRLEDGLLRDFWEGTVTWDPFQRQHLPVLYARNGPAVLVTRTSVVVEEHQLYGRRIVPYIMEEDESVDIDTPDDLRVAEWLLTQRKVAV